MTAHMNVLRDADFGIGFAEDAAALCAIQLALCVIRDGGTQHVAFEAGEAE